MLFGFFLSDESLESTCKSLLQQHSVQMGLDMFGILVERCAQLLAIHIKSDDYPGRMFSRELEELVPGIKVWTNWMICHSYLWNPPPQVRDPAVGWDKSLLLKHALKFFFFISSRHIQGETLTIFVCLNRQNLL